MQCRSCGTPILASFKHAMAQNECPACGGQIMDEESLALIENIEMTIRSEAAVREETAHHLAMSLVARYDITIRDMDQVQPLQNTQVPVKTAVPRKVAPPSAMKQAMQQADIIRASDFEGISEKEREKVFEEAVRERYSMVDQIQATSMEDDYIEDNQSLVPANDSIFSEGAANPILERERLARLAKQQNAMNGGGQGSFRRGS